jgi:hypothetical protein
LNPAPDHGWGNDSSLAYREQAEEFADRYNLVVVRVKYRDVDERRATRLSATYDIPYTF